MPRALLPSCFGPVSSCNGENKILPPLRSPIPTPMGPAVLWGLAGALQAEASAAFGSSEALLGAGESLVVCEDADGAGGGHQDCGEAPRAGSSSQAPGLARGFPTLLPPRQACQQPASLHAGHSHCPQPPASGEPPLATLHIVWALPMCGLCVGGGEKWGKSRQRDPVPTDELSEALQIVPEQGR